MRLIYLFFFVEARLYLGMIFIGKVHKKMEVTKFFFFFFRRSRTSGRSVECWIRDSSIKKKMGYVSIHTYYLRK